MNASTQAPATHRFAVLTATATLALIFVGGLVTSTGSGLSVPDWPLSFGTLMPAMRGGVFYEHGHRMVATSVGLLTVGLAVWLRLREPRAWVRRMGYAAVALVVLQGVLGGLTVLLQLPVGVSVAHAGTAELFLALTTAIAVVTSRTWLLAGPPAAERGLPTSTLALATLVLVYAQVLLGALVRHSGAGLAIPDFPTAYGGLIPPLGSPLIAYHFAHRVGALVAAACIVATATTVLRRHGDSEALRRPALVVLALLAAQIFLGALTIWSRRAVGPTTLHVVTGAGILATMVVLTLRAQRLLAPAAPRAAVPPVGVPETSPG